LTTELSLTITKGHGGGGTLDKKIIRGVYFSVDPPPRAGGGQKYGQITCWGKKMIERE